VSSLCVASRHDTSDFDNKVCGIVEWKDIFMANHFHMLLFSGDVYVKSVVLLPFREMTQKHLRTYGNPAWSGRQKLARTPFDSESSANFWVKDS
jgi:hypothetical protein